MNIAVVHDWLVTYAGAEKVLEQILNVFPEADVFSLIDFLPADRRDFIRNKQVVTSFIQKLPLAGRAYRNYLPLMPLAIEQLDLSAYDLVISSSYAVAKGVLTGPDQVHLSYVHSPIRYAWDLQHQYLRDSGLERGPKRWLASWTLHRIRNWDSRTANGVDGFMANSRFVARRIMKAYRREATVIYPPVDVDFYSLREAKEDFYLTASRMVPYKRIDCIVEAFIHMPDKRLVVIGEGSEEKKIRAKAAGAANIQLLGYQPASVLREYMQRAKAFVFAAEEDFGIAPVEAQACGTPVIAYGKGGVVETVLPAGRSERPTGLFFHEQTASSLKEAVRAFETSEGSIRPEDCRLNALRFSVGRFREQFLQFVERYAPPPREPF